MEDRHAEIAMYREGIIAHVSRLMAGGLSMNKACRHSGQSAATISRWRRAYQGNGLDGLRPDWDRCGRKPLVLLNDEELQTAKRLYMQTGSQTTALRMLACLPECRGEVADAILKPRSSKHALPKSLREQMGVADDVVTYHQSPKQAKFTFLNPRSLTYLDALGKEQTLMPGDLFEKDDMSNNFLCWVPWPWGGDPCSDKYGVRVARGQNLLSIDVASLLFNSYNFLIRLRDSYRADDIWNWVGRIYRDVGMPRIGERWERGTWQSKKLRGDDALIDAGHTDERVRVGGMAALGVRIIVSHSPTTKIIENRFNFLQRVMGTIPGQIGRERGQMERETKVWMQCQRGERDPRDYFLSVDEASNRIAQALEYVNHEPVEGLIYKGIPAELWQSAVSANPLKTLPEEKAYLFSRDKATVRENKGNVLVRYTAPDGQRGGWWFYHPELRRHSGMQFHVHYDEYQPRDGATLVFAEGPQMGKVLGHAELADGAPQFALGIDPDCGRGATAGMDAMERRKRHNAAVHSEYRAIAADGTRFAARQSRIDDGAGREIAVSVGTANPQPAPAAGEPARLPKVKRRETTLEDLQALEAQAKARGGILTTY